MKYNVSHQTKYNLADPISIAHNKGWLEPRPRYGQQLLEFQLDIQPAPSIKSREVDTFGNPVWLFSFNEGYSSLSITARSQVSVSASVPPPDSPTCGELRELLRRRETEDVIAATEFQFPSTAVHWNADMREWAGQSFSDDLPVVSALRDLTARIHEEYTYDPSATKVDTHVEEVFRKQRGVCQDFAHVELAFLRSLGFAARYVSGYLRTYPPAGKPRLIGADASHAWLSVYCGQAGWIDIDPTNNVFTSDDHITLAWGRDYHEVPPLAGVCVGGSGHQLRVSVDVEPVESESE